MTTPTSKARDGGSLRQLVLLVRADARRDGTETIRAALVRSLFTTRFQAVLLMRVSQALHQKAPLLGSLVKYVNTVLTGCDISPAARIGPGFCLFHPTGVVIGPDVRIGRRCTVQQSVTLGFGSDGSPSVGDDVVIGPGAVVIGGITLGEMSRVGANAVVTRDVPGGELWAGVPARYQRPTRTT